MDGSIYDFGLTRTAFAPAEPAYAVRGGAAREGLLLREERPAARAVGSIGLISNPRSHRNRRGIQGVARPGVLAHAPRTRSELREILAMFARRGIDLLAIDGGDGTIRDVLTCAGDVWDRGWPDVAILPAGKTNALALDLGVPAGWTLDQAIGAAARGRFVERAPLEVTASGAAGVTVRGFLFGAGAFVDATALAQRTHRAGAFDGIAVGLALSWGVGQTLFGGADNPWRRGTPITIGYGERAVRMHDTRPDGARERYLMLASTLTRLPLGLKPFGKLRDGLKTLVVDAPPRQLAATVGRLLAGSQSPGLERRGYHRVDSGSLTISIAGKFIIDGETFPAGEYVLREASPLRFVVP